MTYYEEFGISSSATPEQIRHAHRRLVKLLHPDLQMESSARQLAEIQTRRINGIAQVLTDKDLRCAYDASLLAPPQQPLVVSQPLYPLIFTVAVVLFFACLGLSQGDRWSSAAGTPPQPVNETKHAPNRTVPSPLRTPGAPNTANKSRSPGPAVPLSDEELDLRPRQSAARRLETPVPVEPPGPKVNNPPPSNNNYAPSSFDSPLIGTWIYVPAPVKAEDAHIYRPEYIEMRIRSFRGVLEGQYRARYRVPDRPLSPNVGFHFAGQNTTGSDGAAFKWKGANGLGGNVELKLMSTNSLQVDWRVTEFAESADLVSGTAVLTRVQWNN